ncbi:hypothetical protein Poli38472_012596 [Pythium oligandrum]|uniref:FYVE-type domain-containing protein n=1 Tax=Pythium oligandrum TaxID=41045 RepID=A0A8K1CDX9_PYTOL|nr:hypothetical protein Poli38472_012596 [Pythium oligandrum]|eukprot:TMW61405.1 hypothetical protein Poli38472_012596 [Pythium oligandrum]
MKARSFAIPTLSLSPSEAHKVEAEVAALLKQTLQIECDFLSKAGTLGGQQWKELKTRDHFTIYKERHRARSRARSWDPTATSRSLSMVDQEDMVSMKKNQQVPMIVSTGHVKGTVEDVVFGFAAGDEVSWRIRTAYMKDQFADAKFVATIKQPTEEQPLNYLCIKWFVSEFPKVISAFVHPRDFLVSEASGVKVDGLGKRFGYYIITDYVHPMISKMDDCGVVRSSISMCFIIREVSPGKVHVFSRGFVDPKGDLSPNITAALAARPMAGLARTAEASIAKKLMWLITQQQRKRCEQPQQEDQQVETESCTSCDRPRGFLKGRLTPCRLCRDEFCSRCIIQRTLVVDVSRNVITERTYSFCLSCILKAKRMSPHTVAVDAIRPSTGRPNVISISSQRTASDVSSQSRSSDRRMSLIDR